MKKLILSIFLAIALFASCTEVGIEIEEITVNTNEITDNSAKITFSYVEEATYYDITLGKKGETAEPVKTIKAEEPLEIVVVDLLAETNYEVKVSAFSASEEFISEGTTDFETLAIESSENPLSYLLGTWMYKDEYYSETYVFNEDGTGTFVSIEGTDKADEYSSKIKWEAEELQKDNGSESGKITITTFSNKNDGKSWDYTYDYMHYGSDKALTIGSRTFSRPEIFE